MKPKVKATPIKNRGEGPPSVEVTFFSLSFKLEGSAEEDAVETK